MQNPDNTRSSSLGGRVLRWAERLLVIAGAAMLALCMLLVTDASIAQRFARRSLEAASNSDTPADPRGPSETTGLPMPAPILAGGSAIANLLIPRVHLSQALVRDAIEHFRLTYNGRLILHDEVRRGGPLRFQTCDVTTIDDQASAICDASPRSPDDSQPHLWTLTLERADDGWAIRSIAMQ